MSFFKYLLGFSGFIDSTAEDSDRKQGERGAQARSQTQIRCRASAHGTPALSNEVNAKR